ncbi:helix-turn-helix domain-containing protein [Planctomycetaceae bacterium SH139]
MKRIPLVRKVVLQPAFAFLQNEGIPLGPHLCRAKLSPPSPNSSDSLIPLHQLCIFLNSFSRAEGIHDLGFRIAGYQGIGSLGIYGKIVMQSFTLHEFVQHSIRLIKSYNSGLQIWTEKHGQTIKYCQMYDHSLPSAMTTEIVQLGLANALAHASLATSATFAPNRIQIPTDPLDLASHFKELKDAPVDFNRPYLSIWFDQRLLSCPLSAQVSRLAALGFNNDERNKFLSSAPATKFMEQLEQVVLTLLGSSALNLQSVSSIIGCSPRTVQRRLAEEDLDFGQLLQSIRFRTAQKLLHDPTMPLAEIAKRLSYADSANFSRAFRRWTGMAPKEFSNMHFREE